MSRKSDLLTLFAVRISAVLFFLGGCAIIITYVAAALKVPGAEAVFIESCRLTVGFLYALLLSMLVRAAYCGRFM